MRYPEKFFVRDQLLIDLWLYVGGMTCALRQNFKEYNFMLRITENSQNGEAIIFRLDGTLTVASCVELEAMCSQYQESDGKMIHLDMAGVVFMNEEVAKRLVELRTDRLSIINCSPFIEMLLKTVAP
jgi:anti-anti-sigma regulatory factor